MSTSDFILGPLPTSERRRGGLRNSEYLVHLQTKACLARTETGEVIYSLDLSNGDGFCMGYHGWLEGDFGKDPVAISKAPPAI